MDAEGGGGGGGGGGGYFQPACRRHGFLHAHRFVRHAHHIRHSGQYSCIVRGHTETGHAHRPSRVHFQPGRLRPAALSRHHAAHAHGATVQNVAAR